MLAALASAAMPSIVMAGVRDSERANDTDDAAGIDQAVMQDAAGRMYDIYACDTEDGRKRLTGRVQAARTLERAKDPGGLGFALDTVLAFVDGREKSTLTGGATVMVAAHNDGVARPLDLLTLDDCAAMGTAIGAIHRLRPNFLQAESYPVFSTGQIRAQLTAWIKRLRQAGHVPPEEELLAEAAGNGAGSSRRRACGRSSPARCMAGSRMATCCFPARPSPR